MGRFPELRRSAMSALRNPARYAPGPSAKKMSDALRVLAHCVIERPLDGVGVDDDKACVRVPRELVHESGAHELSGEEHEAEIADALARASRKTRKTR